MWVTCILSYDVLKHTYNVYKHGCLSIYRSTYLHLSQRVCKDVCFNACSFFFHFLLSDPLCVWMSCKTDERSCRPFSRTRQMRDTGSGNNTKPIIIRVMNVSYSQFYAFLNLSPFLCPFNPFASKWLQENVLVCNFFVKFCSEEIIYFTCYFLCGRICRCILTQQLGKKEQKTGVLKCELRLTSCVIKEVWQMHEMQILIKPKRPSKEQVGQYLNAMLRYDI